MYTTTRLSYQQDTDNRVYKQQNLQRQQDEGSC